MENMDYVRPEMLTKNQTISRMHETDWFDNPLFPHKLNLDTQTFVAGWYTSKLGLIDEINDWFAQAISEGYGDEGRFGNGKIDKTKKESYDVCFQDNPDLCSRYFREILDPAFQSYLMLYPWANNVSRFTVVETTNLQEYKPGSNGYALWHAEATGWRNASRHLVFMTYLNDVEDGGETEFWTQKLKVKPEKGLTLIFPAAWTHHHRGRASPNEYKRFVTGWYSYYSEDCVESEWVQDAIKKEIEKKT